MISYIMQAGDYNDPLMADFVPPFTDPAQDWQMAYQMAGARAQRLTYDFPIAQGMILAKLIGTHGSRGMRHRSVFARDDALDTDDQEEQARSIIDGITDATHNYVDAMGVMSRAEWEWELDKIATTFGDGFGIRVLQKGRGRFSTAWRMVHPWRLCNEPGKPNGVDGWLDGGKFVGGRLVAIGYSTEPTAYPGMITDRRKWRLVKMVADDGTPNVIHRRGLSMMTHWRGLSMFAPIILESRLLQGLGVAYVATKRTQASHPLMIKTENVQAAREQYKGTRMANLVMGLDDDVVFSHWKFEGADYREFYDTNLRNLCSPWGIPYELAVGDHSAKSGASARSTWQAYWMHSARYQDAHIFECSNKLDTSYVIEEKTRNNINFQTDDIDRIMRGKYLRPPRLMPDPLKEAQAVTEWRANAVSLTTLQDLSGFDFTDEQRIRHQERIIAREQDVDSEESGGINNDDG